MKAAPRGRVGGVVTNGYQAHGAKLFGRTRTLRSAKRCQARTRRGHPLPSAGNPSRAMPDARGSSRQRRPSGPRNGAWKHGMCSSGDRTQAGGCADDVARRARPLTGISARCDCEAPGLDECGDTGKPCYIIGDDGPTVKTLFIGNQCILPNVIRYLTKAALLSATLAIVALPGLARAQSGSAGGSIGNDEKSLSGSRETPRAAEPSKPARRAANPRPKRRAAASRKSGGGGNGGGNFDGAWVLTSVGSPCGTSSDTVVITGSRMVGQYGTSQVSPNGATSGIGSAGSLTWSMSGRFSGRSGSGTFRRSDGCAGSWTGAKQ